MKIDESIGLSLVGACSQIGIRSISQNITHQICHLQHSVQLKNSLIDMWVCSNYIDHLLSIVFFSKKSGLVKLSFYKYLSPCFINFLCARAFRSLLRNPSTLATTRG